MASLVSICIPAYKQPRELIRCLASIYAQTFTDFEVIITDDTPDDSVREAIGSFARAANLRYFYNPEPQGSPANWNEGLRRASGEYAIVLHHDDWFYSSTTLQELVRTALDSGSDMVFARSYGIDSEMKIISRNEPSRERIGALGRNRRTLFYGNVIGAPSAVLFRNEGMFFDTRLLWLVDVDFYIRYLKKRSLRYASKAIVAIGISSSQISQSCFGNMDREIAENIAVYRKLDNAIRYIAADYSHFRRLFERFEVSKKSLMRFSPPTNVRLFFGFFSLSLAVKNALKRAIRWKHG